MEISPLSLSFLLLYSFVFGAFLGVFHDANRIVRIFCGVHYSEKRFKSLYARRLPIVHRSLSVKETKGLRKGALNLLIFFQDILLFLVGAVGLVILHYEYNSGRFRFFSLLAMVVGFLLYYFTLGKLVMFFSEAIVFVIKATFLIVFDCILRPIRAIGRFLSKNLKKIGIFYQIFLEKRRRKLYNINKKKRLLTDAKKGFVSFDV